MWVLEWLSLGAVGQSVHERPGQCPCSSCYHCCLESNRTCVLPPNWQCPTASCLLIPGCFLLSSLKRGLQTVSQCLPRSTCIFLLLCVSSLARCLNPLYTKAENWLQEGVRGGPPVAERQQCSHPVLWTRGLSHSTIGQSALERICLEGLKKKKKPKKGNEDHSCVSHLLVWLPPSR